MRALVIAGLAAVAHGLLIHEHITGSYGVTLTQERRASVHVRPVAGLLGRMMAEDSRALTVAREPASRLPGNCRHPHSDQVVAALHHQLGREGAPAAMLSTPWVQAPLALVP